MTRTDPQFPPVGNKCDIKWLSGILAVAVLAAGILSFSLAQLTTPTRVKLLLEQVLELTLLPALLPGSLAERVLPGEDIGLELGDRLRLPSQLEGLSPVEADRVVLSALAELAFAKGSEVVAAQLGDLELASKLRAVAAVVDSLTQDAHRRYLWITYLIATLALLSLAGLVLFSCGFGRLANPGLALFLAAVPGVVLFSWLNDFLQSAALVLPASVRTTGAIAFLADLLGYIGARLPTEVFDLLSRNHLIVLLVGAGLVALALLMRLGQFFGSNRPKID